MVTSTAKGVVTWKTEQIGQISLSLLDGYDIYKNNKKLNTATVPIPSGGGVQSFSSDQIIENDPDVVVVIKDTYGNIWPEVKTDMSDLQKCTLITFGMFNSNVPMDVTLTQNGTTESKTTLPGWRATWGNRDPYVTHAPYGAVTWKDRTFTYTLSTQGAGTDDPPLFFSSDYWWGYGPWKYAVTITGTIDDQGNIGSATVDITLSDTDTPSVQHIECTLGTVPFSYSSVDSSTGVIYYRFDLSNASAPTTVTNLKANWSNVGSYDNGSYVLVKPRWSEATSANICMIAFQYIPPKSSSPAAGGPTP